MRFSVLLVPIHVCYYLYGSSIDRLPFNLDILLEYDSDNTDNSNDDINLTAADNNRSRHAKLKAAHTISRNTQGSFIRDKC